MKIFTCLLLAWFACLGCLATENTTVENEFIKAFAKKEWVELLHTLEDQRYNFGLVKIEDKVHVLGGYGFAGGDTIETLDLKTHTWDSYLPPKKRSKLAVVAVPGKILMFGGGRPRVKTVDELNLKTREWRERQEMEDPARDGAKAVVRGNYVFLVGGHKGYGKYISSVEIYNWKANVWSKTKPMSITRGNHCVAIVKDQLVVIGGKNEDGHISKTEVFDFESQVWRTVASMPTPRESCGAVAVGDRYVVVAGGEGVVMGSLATVEVLDMEEDEWYTLPNMTLGRFGCELFATDDHIYAVAGYNNEEKTLSTTERIQIPKLKKLEKVVAPDETAERDEL